MEKSRVLQALDSRPFAVIAHRLGGKLGPENTLPALEASIRAGAEIAEADIRITRDGVPVVLHDDEIRIPSGARVKVRELTYERINEFLMEPLLALSSLLKAAKGRIPLFLEIKDVEAVGPVLEEVESETMVLDVAVISFHVEALVKARKMNPSIVTGVVYFRPPGMILECKRIGCRIVLPRYNVATPRAVGFAHRLGLKVATWTINESTLAKLVASRGVDGIATDDPALLAKVKEELSKHS